MNPKKVMFWALVFVCLFGLMAICCLGCAWQGQKYPVAVKVGNKYQIAYDEWWSMRFAWQSAGVELYTQSANYKSGGKINTSKSDPNTAEVIADSIMDKIEEFLVK